MNEPLEAKLKEILNAESKSEMIRLIETHRDYIAHSHNLISFFKTARDNGNKNLLQAFNETRIFESKTISYYTRIDLLNSLANSYSFAYGSNLKLSRAQLDALHQFKNSDDSVINDEFRRLKSSLKVLDRERPDLIEILKPFYFPENFSSEIKAMGKITGGVDEATEKAQIKKVAQEIKDNISLMAILERANHILEVDKTIKYKTNIFQGNEKGDPRFTAENSAIRYFLDDFPNKSSRDYQYIKSATNAASMLFHFVRSVNELKEFQKENNLNLEKLSKDKLEQLVRILNRVAQSYDDMGHYDRMLRSLIANEPKQAMISKLAPPTIQEQQISKSSNQTQQLVTKPELRFKKALFQETFAKLEQAFKDNNKEGFNQLIDEMAGSAKPYQLNDILKSLQQLRARITKSPESNTDPNRLERLSLLQEGILKLQKTNTNILAQPQENQSASTPSKGF